MNLKKAALFMGYREISKDKFLKPVGYSCLAIKTDTLEFVSFFKAKWRNTCMVFRNIR